MRKPKIYLETTLFNFYVDVYREAHADTVQLFREIAEGKYDAYTSDYVIDELERIVKRKTVKMTGAINVLNGYHAVEIYSPMEVVENENG
ncbi:MAG: hypothetical protein FWF88_09295 [Peptococcaceae bacterium]|nr:hypothetical protein [Peptococcaceae bacterium]